MGGCMPLTVWLLSLSAFAGRIYRGAILLARGRGT